MEESGRGRQEAPVGGGGESQAVARTLSRRKCTPDGSEGQGWPWDPAGQCGCQREGSPAGKLYEASPSWAWKLSGLLGLNFGGLRGH